MAGGGNPHRAGLRWAKRTMSDLHRQKMQRRLDALDEARELYDECVELDNPALDTRKISDYIKQASTQADSQHFDHKMVNALGLIASQTRAVGQHELADRARAQLDEFKS